MTLEEAIKHCEEIISDCETDVEEIHKLLKEYPERASAFRMDLKEYADCAVKQRQLAEWLTELQERRKQEIIRCIDCKHLVNIGCSDGRCYQFSGFGSKVRFDDYCSRAEKESRWIN